MAGKLGKFQRQTFTGWYSKVKQAKSPRVDLSVAASESHKPNGSVASIV